MRCTSSSGLWAALLTSACSYAPAPAWPRPALPTPAHVAAHFALPATPTAVTLAAAPDGGSDGTLVAGGELARFHYRPLAGQPRGPVVLLIPILAGGTDLMTMLASRLRDRGFHAAWCDRVAPALQPPQRGPELEALFRRTVIQQRMLLAWLRQRPEVDAGATFVLGVSMGGIVASAVAVAEPDLRGVGICIAGADLPDLVLHSGEERVRRWVAWRQTADAYGDSTIAQDLRRCLSSDPAVVGPYVPTEKVVLVTATLDDVIPPRHRDLLWEALGRPRNLFVPLGHYSVALALDAVLDEIAGFFVGRLDRTAG